MGHWRKVKIGEFLFEREGKYKPDSEAISGLKRIDKIDFSGNFHITQKPSKTNMILIHPGDLVISGINVSKGAMGIYSGEEDVTATIHYSSYTFDTSMIDVEYFKRFLKSSEFIRLLKEQVKGGIKTEIKPKHILPLEIELPDIQEQWKIVEHFKSIETEDAELKNELTHQQTLLKKLRQQILQEAIEGKLTADWRAAHPDVEPASELLKRIQAEKAQLIKDKKIKKQKPLPPISEEEKPFNLPEGWVWCRLGDTSNLVTDGTHKTPAYTQSGIKFISAKDIKSGKINFSKCKYISESEHSELAKRCLPEFNDLLISKSGSIGTVVLNTSNELFSLFESLALVKYNQNEFFPPYYKLTVEFICANLQREQIRGVAVKHLHLNVMRTLLLAIPPLPEQKAIVAKVEKLLALCDQLESQITTNQTHAEQLMQAVLKEAFQPAEQASTVQDSQPTQQATIHA